MVHVSVKVVYLVGTAECAKAYRKLYKLTSSVYTYDILSFQFSQEFKKRLKRITEKVLKKLWTSGFLATIAWLVNR